MRVCDIIEWEEVNIMPVSRKKRASNNKWDKENMKIVACKIRADKAEQFKQYAEDKQTTPNALLRGYIYDCIGAPGEDSSGEPPDSDESGAEPNTEEIKL